MNNLAAAHADVLRRMARACERARREPSGVALVAVSKTVPAEAIRSLVECGQVLFGENRVQEALGKIPAVGAGARWHLVGHLQRNKARHAVGVFELIHSVADIDLARELDRRAELAGAIQRILVEVNVSGEGSKQGIDELDLPRLLDGVAGLAHLDLGGLMCIPAPVERAEESRGAFAHLRELRDQASIRIGRSLSELSMGMTDDFEVAIEEGATLIRVGRALFGKRGQTPFNL